MAHLRDMLDAEMETSKEFTRNNYGLAVGDGYRNMVEDIVQNKQLQAKVLVNMMMIGLTGKEVAESLKEDVGEHSLKNAIIKNHETFKGTFEMLYWGIQIGRKLEREEKSVLDGIEHSSRIE